MKPLPARTHRRIELAVKCAHDFCPVALAGGNYEAIRQNALSGRYEIKASYPGSGDGWGSSVVIRTVVR